MVLSVCGLLLCVPSAVQLSLLCASFCICVALRANLCV